MVVDDDGKSYDTTRVSITSSVKYIYIYIISLSLYTYILNRFLVKCSFVRFKLHFYFNQLEAQTCVTPLLHRRE